MPLESLLLVHLVWLTFTLALLDPATTQIGRLA
jgi:hypothetical protein